MFVHCLGILAAVPALPSAAPKTPPPAAVRPAPAAAVHPVAATAPTPTDGASASAPAPPPLVSPSVVVPTQGAPSPVEVAVTPAGTPAPGYQVRVRNTGNRPVSTTVRQELPAGTSATWITPGGRASRSANSTEVSWRLSLPARSTTTLHTALSAAAPGRALTAPACAFTSNGDRPYDCATATWHAAAPGTEVTAAPAWRRPPVLLGALAVVLLLTLGGLWWWRRQQRRRAGGRPPTGPTGRTSGPTGPPTGTTGPTGPPTGTTGRTGPAGAAGSSGSAAASPAGVDGATAGRRGTVYPRSAAPGDATAPRRRRPPVWLVVGGAATVLVGVVLAAALTATQRVAAVDTAKQPTSGAWVGHGTTGAVGVPLREQAMEFTVYRIACPQPPSAGDRQCQATVGVRNVSAEEQTWHGQLQRAYLPGGTWVSTDEAATRRANQGRDVFAQPLAAGTRLVLPLVFTVDGPNRPQQLELRSGVFSAGVRVDVP
ncbi:hypothetical protein [Micromonospora sp. DT233]|uniref:hypothetical protein n=1 Tax=Micromonospora sp. DT233 TaxID=3393432 RepID=UPI003CF54685